MKRWRYHAWGIALAPLAPILLPILCGRVGYEKLAGVLAWQIPARRRWWLRLWWWYGYHGLYQIDWALKHRAYLAEDEPPLCGAGRWPLNGIGIGEACDRVALHRGKHHMVWNLHPDPRP